MIIGIGIDTVKISRMEKSLGSEAFFKKVFGIKEQEMLQQRTGKRLLEGAAANFAAKEAFLKATGMGIGGFCLNEIEVIRDEKGCPAIHLTGKALEYSLLKNMKTHISITHEGEYATAFVILEN